MNKVFEERYKKLNARQKQAVEAIDGPLLVIAGPGTGKTELLSMRAANILRLTDTLASNILCLTFTDSGAAAMRERLSDIIGPEAYKVAIYTFHGFGTEIINQNAEYFYHGAAFRPADELTQYEILSGIFDDLDYKNILASRHGTEYTYLKDVAKTISELKRSGIASEELRIIVEANDMVCDAVEDELQTIFANRVGQNTIHQFAPLAELAANVPQPILPLGITPYANTLALSIAHAVDEARETGKTTPITAWKNTWCEKNSAGQLVLKDRKRHTKLQAVVYIYYEYLRRMEEAGLYDYDDMILQVISAIETRADLKANLQEKFQYIMVDEFQDTNLAQLRLLFNLTDSEHNQAPNIMVVGDDDQAIYSFQGADVNNIHKFRTQYNNPDIIVLTDNYRSTPAVIETARSVITQGADRLEHTIADLDKKLSANSIADNIAVSLQEYSTSLDERQAIANQVTQQIASGVTPGDIAIIARRHHELIELLPYLADRSISVNYERRDDALENEIVKALEGLVRIVVAFRNQAHDKISALIPQIIAHPAFGYSNKDIWQLSLTAYANHQTWLETMQTTPVFVPISDWLIDISVESSQWTLEHTIDVLLGVPDVYPSSDYQSPLYQHYFSDDKRQSNPSAYLETLEALRSIREKLREHFSNQAPTLESFIEFVDMHRDLGATIATTRAASEQSSHTVNLLTAHKAKGLEFNHVYIIGAVDSSWGERVRLPSRNISYPANLPLAAAGGSYDERLRLFFVAMTRAKHTLNISYSTHDTNQKNTLPASFLTGTQLTAEVIAPDDTVKTNEKQLLLDWQQYIVNQPSQTMKDLLASQLERYKLSATHLNNFIDVTRGGPQYFLLNNLLHFPQEKSASAAYGTAIHATLQQAHNHLVVTGDKKPIEDVVADFEKALKSQYLNPKDHEKYLQRGAETLQAYLSHRYDTFSVHQRTELSFASQGIVIGAAKLTGNLDLIDIDKESNAISVTDYKTGKASRDWKGKSEFEKIKLHKYRQQLMFYQLLVDASRDFSSYQFTGGCLQFVEPTREGEILALRAQFDDESLEQFRLLINAVWQSITQLDLPDITMYDPTLNGIKQFETDLIDKYS